MSWDSVLSNLASTPSLFAPVGSVAQADAALGVLGLLLMSIVVIPVFVLLAIVIIRFRHTNRSAPYTPEWEKSTPLEIAIWGVPALIVLILGVVVWARTHTLDPARPLSDAAAQPYEIDVIAMDWKWLFLYPKEQVAMVNTLMFPVDRPVRLNLTSASTMQSFFIPQLGSQIYAMAGMVTRLHLDALQGGTYRGLNTQYNGMGFPDQHFEVHAVSASEYSQRLHEVAKTSQPLTQAAWKALLEPKVQPSPLYFAGYPRSLFDDTVAQFRYKTTVPARPDAASQSTKADIKEFP